jgi:hypothetical protein
MIAAPADQGKKYKKCCLAETFVQIGKEDTISIPEYSK